MSNLVDHAKFELEVSGWFSKDGVYDGMIGEAVLALVKVFAEQGHSGQSAILTLSLFAKVAAFEPIGPLTGKEEEWVEVDTGLFQNKRCSHVFRENGLAYDIDGRVFQEPSGIRFTNWDSRVPVTFPYTPKSEIVPVTPSLEEE